MLRGAEYGIDRGSRGCDALYQGARLESEGNLPNEGHGLAVPYVLRGGGFSR